MLDKLLLIIKELNCSEVNESFALAIAKRLEALSYAPTESDAYEIALTALKIINSIKNSCNIAFIPNGLRNVAVDMVCGEFLFVKKQSGGLNGYDFEATVKQMQAGDTNITFKDELSSEQQFDSLLSFLMNKGKDEFVCYRKIKW